MVNKAGISIYGRLSFSAIADTHSVEVEYGRDREWVSAALLGLLIYDLIKNSPVCIVACCPN